MALLTWEDGVVKIDGQELPGILDDLDVDGRVKFDEQNVDGQSGKKRTPMGWEDTEVSLRLCLTTEDDGPDCYDKLTEINGIFRAMDGNANPKVYTVDNRHLLARGVGELIFSGLSSSERDRDDTVTAYLSFVENNPPVIKTETSVAKNALAAVAGKKKQEEAQKKVAVPEINPAELPDGKKPVVIDVAGTN
jgi:hypothetical protein